MLNFAPSPSYDYAPVPQNPPIEIVRTALTAGVKTQIIDPVTQVSKASNSLNISINEKTGLVITQYKSPDGYVRMQLPPQQVVRVYEQASSRTSAVTALGLRALPGDRIAVEIARASQQTSPTTGSKTTPVTTTSGPQTTTGTTVGTSPIGETTTGTVAATAATNGTDGPEAGGSSGGSGVVAIDI